MKRSAAEATGEAGGGRGEAAKRSRGTRGRGRGRGRGSAKVQVLNSMLCLLEAMTVSSFGYRIVSIVDEEVVPQLGRQGRPEQQV